MPGAVQPPHSLKSNLRALAASKRPVKAITSLIFPSLAMTSPSGCLLQSQRMGPFLEGRPMSLFPEGQLVCSIACVSRVMFIKVETLYEKCSRSALYSVGFFLNVWRQKKHQFTTSMCFSLFNIHSAITTNCRVLSELQAFKTSQGKTSHQINLPSSGNSILFAFANVLYVAVIALKQISAPSSSQD